MPIYEYACQSCEHSFDVLQKMNEAPLLDCPECGKPRLKKLLSAPNFRLKGGGWYETDFKKDNQRNLAGDRSDTSKEGKKEAAKEGKAESKNEGKTDKKSTDAGQATAKKSETKSGQKKGASGTNAD